MMQPLRIRNNRQVEWRPSGTFFPVITGAPQHRLDTLVRAHLPRYAPRLQGVLASAYYARRWGDAERSRWRSPARDELALLIDSGGFVGAADATVRVEETTAAGGAPIAVLRVTRPEGEEAIHPDEVLALQGELADVGFPLDCFIAPDMPADETARRAVLTLANARYALQQRGKRFPHLRLFGVIQAQSPQSAAACARALTAMRDDGGRGFDGLAIGGLVPHARDLDYASGIVTAVRAEAPGLPIHVFGIGQPESIRRLVAAGATSSDSSAYARDAVRGRSWRWPEASIDDAALGESLMLALEHLDALC
jgi:tRNA-guanine family transglycosylase